MTAVLLWEMKTLANRYGGISLTFDYFGGLAGDGKTKNKGAGASVGLAQLEIYKIRIVMIQEYGKKWDGRKIGDYAEYAMHPNNAIHLTAAWMKYLKKNVWYMKDGQKHYIDDVEAAVAYCGCSGVTVVDPMSGTMEVNSNKFRIWAESGWKDSALTTKSSATGVKRRNQLLEWLRPGHGPGMLMA